MRSALAAAALLLVLPWLAPPAKAGRVYRCEGEDGVASYGSRRVPGQRCTLVANYRPQRVRPAAPAPPTEAPVTAGGESADAATGEATPAVAPATPSAPRTPRYAGMGTSVVYSYVDGSGVKHYSNRRPAGVAGVSASRYRYPVFVMDTCYACAPLPKVSFSTLRLNTDAYRDEIAAAARANGVEQAIVRAVIHAESSFNPRALSRVGAQGLMQLMPATARRFGVSDAFDPPQNIRGGVAYLAWLLKRYQGDLSLAAAGYNAGEGAVDRYKGVPPYDETRRYVSRVRILAERYRMAENGK
jgi:soluble lytic murein transglycosylase-like protein